MTPRDTDVLRADLLRPTFRLNLDRPPERAAAALEALTSEQGGPFPGQSTGSHVTLTIARGERHFWSPWLHLELTPSATDPARTDLFGRFSPAPSIWTGFMLTYIALFTLGLFAAVWAMAQVMLEGPPTALWVVLLTVVIAAAMLVSARIGQGLALDQMARLREAVGRALDEPGHAGPARGTN